MNWIPRSVPEPTAETEAFWRAAGDEDFIVSKCQNCGLIFTYSRLFCPDCFSEDVTSIKIDGEGEIYSYSTVNQNSNLSNEQLPYLVAYVELDIGPRIVTNIVDCDPDEIRVGTRVAVRFAETSTPTIGIPLFSPVS